MTATLDALEAEGRVVFRYVDKTGTCHAPPPTPTARSATSPASAIARRRVLGMMPHPERLFEPMLGSADGRRLLESVVGDPGA